MTNEEKILHLLELQQVEFQKINTRLDSLDTRVGALETQVKQVNVRLDSVDARLDSLEESAEITREGVNTLIGWAEEIGHSTGFPLPQIG